jgi:hypothetical protein
VRVCELQVHSRRSDTENRRRFLNREAVNVTEEENLPGDLLQAQDLQQCGLKGDS